MLCLWFVYLVKNNEVGAMLAVLNVFFAPKHGDSWTMVHCFWKDIPNDLREIASEETLYVVHYIGIVICHWSRFCNGKPSGVMAPLFLMIVWTVTMRNRIWNSTLCFVLKIITTGQGKLESLQSLRRESRVCHRRCFPATLVPPTEFGTLASVYSFRSPWCYLRFSPFSVRFLTPS